MNLRFIHWKAVPIYLVSILVPFALENSADIVQLFSPRCEDNKQGITAKVSAWYYGLLEKLSPFVSTPNHVRIVTVDSDVEGGWVRNACDARRFTGRLLSAIGDVQPAAIVVDWSNGIDSCLDAKVNHDFEKHVHDVNAIAPVVFGRSTWATEDERGELPDNAIGTDRFIEKPDLLKDPGIPFGLLRLNCDVRKIPLGWYVYPSMEAAKTSKPKLSNNTLSVLAVSSSNNAEALNAGNLPKLMKKNVHPFAHFFSSLKLLSAVDLLCERRPDKFNPEATCPTGPEQKGRLQSLRSKIVLISDVSPEEKDEYESPTGTVNGVELHANYIESLISGHYWKPVRFIWQLLVSVVWFGVIESIFEACKRRPWRALLYVVGATLLFAFIFYYIVVMLMGYYFVLLSPSLILIGIRAWQLIKEKFSAA